MTRRGRRFAGVSRRGAGQGAGVLVPLVAPSEGRANAGDLQPSHSVTFCRSPRCAGEVVLESDTDGHCLACGLHHHRRPGTVPWAHVIGPIVVTVLGSIDGEEEAIDADIVRFVAKYMTIEATRGPDRYIVSMPASRLANIVGRY
jgi:hypothetical protein